MTDLLVAIGHILYPWGYVAFVAFAVGSALLSGHAPTIKVSFLIMAEWILSNIAVAQLQFSNAASVIPEIDAIAALILATVCFPVRDGPNRAVFYLFILDVVISVVAILMHKEASFDYFAALNFTLVVKALITGGAGVAHYLANRPHWRDIVSYHIAPSRSDHVAGASGWKT